MIDLFLNPLLEAIGWTLLHSLWQGMIVALIIGILLNQLKAYEANLRYFIGLLGLAVIIFWSSLTFKTYYNLPVELNAGFSDGFLISIADPALIKTGTIASFWESATSYLSTTVEVIIPWFLIFWTGGLLIFTLKNILGILEVRRLRLSGKSSLDLLYVQMLESLQHKLRINQRIQLFESDLVRTPLVIGIIKPVILFPVGLVTGLSNQQAEAILLHELAHIKRQDYLINIIQTILETIFFFNPAIWYLSSWIREERENCCDDIAIENESDPIEYARALTIIGSFQAHEFAMSASGSGNKLYSRIKRMFNPSKRTTMKDRVITMLILGITLVSLTIYTFRSYSEISEQLLLTQEEVGETNLLKAEASSAIMTPAMITLLESVKSPETLDMMIDEDDDEKKKKKKQSKAQLREELKEKEEKIRELEEELEKAERTKVYRYDRQSKEEREKAREERDKARDARDDARSERDKVREKREHYYHYESDRIEDLEDYELSMEKFREEMEVLKEELEQHDYSGSYHFDLHGTDGEMIETINEIMKEFSSQIMHFPDIAIHLSEDLEIEIDDLHQSIELHETELEEAIEKVAKVIELQALKIEEQAAKIEVEAIKIEKHFKEFEKELKKELVKDGLIKNVNQDIDIHIKNDEISIDGKKLSPELQKKYQKLWEDFSDKEFNFEIKIDNDED